MKMKQPGNDVGLTDGEGFIVTEGPYEAHLEDSVDLKQVSEI